MRVIRWYSAIESWACRVLEWVLGDRRWGSPKLCCRVSAPSRSALLQALALGAPLIPLVFPLPFDSTAEYHLMIKVALFLSPISCSEAREICILWPSPQGGGHMTCKRWRMLVGGCVFSPVCFRLGQGKLVKGLDSKVPWQSLWAPSQASRLLSPTSKT